MNVDFVKRELNLSKLIGSEINDDVIKIIDNIKNSMSYRILSKDSIIWCDKNNEEMIEIDYKSDVLKVYISKFEEPITHEAEIIRTLIGFILDEDFSRMDLSLVWMVRGDLKFNTGF